MALLHELLRGSARLAVRTGLAAARRGSAAVSPHAVAQGERVGHEHQAPHARLAARGDQRGRALDVGSAEALAVARAAACVDERFAMEDRRNTAQRSNQRRKVHAAVTSNLVNLQRAERSELLSSAGGGAASAGASIKDSHRCTIRLAHMEQASHDMRADESQAARHCALPTLQVSLSPQVLELQAIIRNAGGAHESSLC